MTWTTILTLIGLACVSGVLGRMGGAKGFNTKYRDIGCPVVLLVANLALSGFHPHFWITYLSVFMLTWAAMSTYWDWLFGYDCMWFSGLVVGCTGLPLMWVSGDLWWIWVVRIPLLAVTWQLLNKRLPTNVFIWRRDEAEEFLRYGISL